MERAIMTTAEVTPTILQSSYPKKRPRNTPAKITKKSSKSRSLKKLTTSCASFTPIPTRPAPATPLQQEQLTDLVVADCSPSDDLCSATTIFTRSFVSPMLLYSSAPDGKQTSSSSILSTKRQSTTVCFAETEPKLLDYSAVIKAVGVENGNERDMESSIKSPSTSLSPSDQSQEDIEDKETEHCTSSHTAQQTCLPPLPTTVTCPHPSLYPPAPPLPSIQSQCIQANRTSASHSSTHSRHHLAFPSISHQTAVSHPYCPSLFEQGLPPLPAISKSSRLLESLSVNLFESVMPIGSAESWYRKQRNLFDHGNHLLPHRNHQVQGYQQYYTSQRAEESIQSTTAIEAVKTNNLWTPSLTPMNADKDSYLGHSGTKPYQLHQRRKQQFQQGSNNTCARRYSTRSLGDVQPDLSNESRQGTIATGMNGSKISHIGPIRSTRQRSSTVPIRRHTVSDFTAIEKITPSTSSVAPTKLTNKGITGRVRTRTSVACEPCRSFKRKCSGGIPCGLCIQRGRVSDCKYDPGPMSIMRNLMPIQSKVKMAEVESHPTQDKINKTKKSKGSDQLRNEPSKTEENMIPRLKEPNKEKAVAVENNSALDSDIGGESGDSGFEFEDDYTSTSNSDYREDHHHHGYRPFTTYSNVNAGHSNAPSLPPLHTWCPRDNGYSEQYDRGHFMTHVVTHSYSPPSNRQIQPSTGQHPQQIFSCDMPGKAIRYSDKRYSTQSWYTKGRGRSNSNDDRQINQNSNQAQYHRPYYPYTQNYVAPFYPSASHAASQGQLYASISSPLMEKSVERSQGQKYTMPSPPFHHMSHPMERSHVNTCQIPTIPIGWQANERRPVTSSGVSNLDQRDQGQLRESRGAVVASFLKTVEKKCSDILPKSDQNKPVVLIASTTEIQDDSNGNAKVVDSESVHQAIEPNSISKRKGRGRKPKPSTYNDFTDLNKLVEAVEIKEASSQTLPTPVHRYNTRSQTKA